MSMSEAEWAFSVDGRALGVNSKRRDVKPEPLYEIRLVSTLLTRQARM